MATQGQRRAEARRAVRQLRTFYRTADTAGERVERELDRLVKRKTLITVDQLATLQDKIEAWVKAVDVFQKGYASLAVAIGAIPS